MRLLNGSADEMDDAGFVELVARVFQAKEVPVEWLHRLGDAAVRAFHAEDFEVRVRATVDRRVELGPFDDYVDRVCRFVESRFDR